MRPLGLTVARPQAVHESGFAQGVAIYVPNAYILEQQS